MAQYKAEILTIFGSYFGRNDDFINPFWNLLTIIWEWNFEKIHKANAFQNTFFYFSDQCKKSIKYVNKRLNACLICDNLRFSSKRDVFLHVQKKHLVNIGGNPNSNEIDIAGEEVEQNGIENQARMDQDGLSNVVISSGTSLQNQMDLINPRTTLNPNLVNPDMARYVSLN